MQNQSFFNLDQPFFSVNLDVTLPDVDVSPSPITLVSPDFHSWKSVVSEATVYLLRILPLQTIYS